MLLLQTLNTLYLGDIVIFCAYISYLSADRRQLISFKRMKGLQRMITLLIMNVVSMGKCFYTRQHSLIAWISMSDIIIYLQVPEVLATAICFLGSQIKLQCCHMMTLYSSLTQFWLCLLHCMLAHSCDILSLICTPIFVLYVLVQIVSKMYTFILTPNLYDY